MELDRLIEAADSGEGIGANGKPLDSYTPASYQALAANDADLGSTTPVILAIPGGYYYSHLGMQIGKDACLRRLNDALGWALKENHE